MRGKPLIVVGTAVGGAALAMMGFLPIGQRDIAAAQAVVVKGGQESGLTGVELDPSSPNWRLLSEDVGVMLRRDDRMGLRGRLFVRINGAWLPVATDGLADIAGTVPAK